MHSLRPLGLMLLPTLLCVGLSPVCAQESKQAEAKKPAMDKATLEKQFAQTMSGATLSGRFTTTGRPEEKDPKDDTYTLGTVKKLKGDFWLFESKIGKSEVNVPLTIEVLWAGDTPVITLTDFEVPGMGKFTARVLVYRDHYSGYWDAVDHGGLMFGKIIKAGQEEKKE